MKDNETRIRILKYLKNVHDKDPSLYADRVTMLQECQIPDKELGKSMKYLKDADLIDMHMHLGGNFVASIKEEGIEALNVMAQRDSQKVKGAEPLVYSLITETKIYVDSELKKLDPNILTRLNFIYEDLMAQNHDYGFARVAYDCREVLINFLDALSSQPENLENRNEMAKIQLEHVLKACKSEKHGQLISERFNYIISYFNALNNFMNKGGHRDIDFGLEDAKSCLIYTYLFMRDILKLLDEH